MTFEATYKTGLFFFLKEQTFIIKKGEREKFRVRTPLGIDKRAVPDLFRIKQKQLDQEVLQRTKNIIIPVWWLGFLIL
jgi:hypothetical protein